MKDYASYKEEQLKILKNRMVEKRKNTSIDEILQKYRKAIANPPYFPKEAYESILEDAGVFSETEVKPCRL